MNQYSPSWVVFGHLIIDNLRLPDGFRANGRLGGAGTYAALGASLASKERVALVSGVGRDLSQLHRAWLASWNIDEAALIERGPRTPRSEVIYRRDGSRTETPLLGVKHFATMAPTVDDLPEHWDAVSGVYFFATHDAWQWPALVEWARRRAAPVMWEISADSCHPGVFSAVSDRLRTVDILSINLSEARALCGLFDPIECLHRLKRAGAELVTLRMGADGALILAAGRILAAAAAPCDVVVDPTGAGNCYSGAFLAEWCRTRDLLQASTRAAAAAATVLGHYGVPPPANATTATVASNPTEQR